ncbi:hypothetical protein N9K39_02645 [Candidatus Pelagibacter sp.]|nr:hypothetical protein [Candidatus Pelagibacter sp.]
MQLHKKKIDKPARYFVSVVFPNFLYWIILNNINVIEVIKKYIGSIIPSNLAITNSTKS